MKGNSSETLSNLLEKRALIIPDNPAIVFHKVIITYRKLIERVDYWANIISSKNASTNQIVGIVLNRSIDMLVCILAALKAGVAYLPIDPYYPQKRIKYMIDDSKVKLILSETCFNYLFTEDNDVIYKEDIDYKNHCYIKNMNEDGNTGNKSDDLAYVIYTSGSSGTPKGVIVEQKSVINLLEALKKEIDFTQGKKIVSATTVSFDVFVVETIIALILGLTIILADEDERRKPRLLSKLMIDNNVDMMQATPSQLQHMFNDNKSLECLKYLKEIMAAGEVFPPNLLLNLKRYTNAKIYNLYGPTEATVYSTVSDLTFKNCVDIGRPLQNTKIYIINESESLSQVGEEGELYISGEGLAKGYINNHKLTEERFSTKPHICKERLYKTGDLAKWLPDGNIAYLGRKDNQIKIRGHRVELEEIEKNLLKHRLIKQAVVTINGGDNKHISAYYISEGDISYLGLIEHLSKFLPNFMLPSQYIRMSEFPRTPSGKIDRKELPIPQKKLTYNEVDINKKPKLEQKLKYIIEGVINRSIEFNETDVSINFNEIGVNSMDYIKILVKIENEFNIEFSNEFLYANKNSTLMSIISYIKDKL